MPNDPQAAGALGDQHRAVGEKRQRPRVFERAGDGGHADALPLSGVELDRLRRQLVACETRRRDGNATLELHILLTGSRLDPERHGRDGGEDEPDTVVKRETLPSHSAICPLHISQTSVPEAISIGLMPGTRDSGLGTRGSDSVLDPGSRHPGTQYPPDGLQSDVCGRG